MSPSPSSERLIFRTVERLLAGEGAAINYIPPELRATAQQRYTEAVQAGLSDPSVVHDLGPR